MPGGELCVAGLSIMVLQMHYTVKEEVKKWADEVMEESREHYVPIDTGLLKSTGIVTELKNTDDECTIRLSYGGPARYAAAVHERQAHHPHGTWKYLSTPFNNHTLTLIYDIEDALRVVV
jgi:hypothetical protein